MSDQGDYWTDYNRGAAGLPPRNGMYRTWGEQAGHDSSFGNNNNNGGGGAGGLVVLIMALAAIVAIAAAAAVSAVMALPCAYLLILITALFTGGHKLSFGEAYKASFIGFAMAVVIGGLVLTLMVHGLLPILPGVFPLLVWLMNGMPDFSQMEAEGVGGLVAVGIGILWLLAPGVIAFAILLGRRIGHPYSGGVGFMRGLLAGAAVLIVPMLAMGAAITILAPYADPLLRADEITTYLGVTAALVAIMAAAGGLVLGLALMAFGGGLAKGGPMLRTAWFTAAVAMAISGGTAAITILFFRDGDEMLQALIAYSGAGRLRNVPDFAAALPGFLKLTLPGVVAGAMFVAGSLYAYRGVFGWIKAILITVPLCLAALGGAIMLLAQLR